MTTATLTAALKPPGQISRELRTQLQAGYTFSDAIAIVGAGDHPRRAEFEADWNGWCDTALEAVRDVMAAQ